MDVSPNNFGKFRPVCLHLAEALCIFPEILFPGKLYGKAFEKKMPRYLLEVTTKHQLSERSARHLRALAVESDVAKVADKEALPERVKKLLQTLSDREREIIKLLYGLGDGYTCTLEEVGNTLHITRELVRQIEAKALRKLQMPRRSEKLEGFLG